MKTRLIQGLRLQCKHTGESFPSQASCKSHRVNTTHTRYLLTELVYFPEIETHLGGITRTTPEARRSQFLVYISFPPLQRAFQIIVPRSLLQKPDIFTADNKNITPNEKHLGR